MNPLISFSKRYQTSTPTATDLLFIRFIHFLKFPKFFVHPQQIGPPFQTYLPPGRFAKIINSKLNEDTYLKCND